MNSDTHETPRRASFWLLALAMAVGCMRPPAVPGPDGGAHGATLTETADDEDAPDYDPWQPFNEVMFSFNHDILDRFLLKPAATGWQAITPTPVRRSIARAFDNLEMPRRLVNNLLQFRPLGAGCEVARFVVNTTAGVAGLFDVATLVHVDASDADTGQTLALYGLAAGPYLVLPTMPPLTVRDAIGRAADGMLDPVGYFLPFVANRAKSILSTVNERSLNLKLYADVEDSVLDLYSAARNGYLQRRRLVVRRAVGDRDAQWAWLFESPALDASPVVVAAEAPTAVEPPAAIATEPVASAEPPATVVAEPDTIEPPATVAAAVVEDPS